MRDWTPRPGINLCALGLKHGQPGEATVNRQTLRPWKDSEFVLRKTILQELTEKQNTDQTKLITERKQNALIPQHRALSSHKVDCRSSL